MSINDNVRFTPQEKPVLILILLTYFMILLDSSIVFTSIPVMKADLGLSAAEMSWVQDAYTLAFGGALLLGAQLGEVWGRTRVFLGGLIVFAVASLIVGMASTAHILIAARALQGLGAAVVAPTSLTLITAVFHDTVKRTRATAAYGTMAGLGSSGGMLIGGLITTFLSWRFGFWINVPIAVVVLVLAVRFLPALPPRPGRFDVLGAVLLTGSMFLITLALVERSVLPGIIGAIVLVMAVAWERKASAPILPEHLWYHRVRGLTLIARLLFAASLFGMLFMTAQYFELTLGYSALTAGLLMLVNCVPHGATGIMVSSLVTRFGLRRLLLTGLASTATGLGLIAWGMHGSLPILLLGMVLAGLGQGASFGPITSVGIWQSSPSEAGAASGIVNTGHQMGATTGVAGLTSLLAFSPHYSTPLTVSAILMVVALLVMLAATRKLEN